MTYTEQYVYDKVGNVVSMKDKNGVVTNNTYDQLYRLTNTTRGGLSTSYTYDNIDRMLTETNESGTTTYAYSGNNLASITYPDSKSISYEYDIMDNVRKVTDYRNSVFSYRYDPLYNVDDIIQDNRPCVDYYYDVSGALTRTDYRNGSVYYTYDNAMQVTKVKNKWNTTDISEYNYTYDTTGNVKTKSDGTTLTTYTYGLGNRLMSSTDRVTTGTDENGAEVYEETIIDYTYDLDGNLTLKDTTYPASHVHTLMVDGVAENLSSVSRFEQNYFYDNNNRLTKEEDIIIGTPEGAEFPTFYITQVNYTYDNNGNTLTEALTSSSVDEYTKAFTYNKRNQLTGCSKDGTDVASYTYYADGLRRSKTVGTDTTMFYYDRGNIVAEGDGTNITAQNVFGIQGIIKRTEGTTTSHYFKDAHGDTKQIVDGTTGTVTQSYEYDAYGNESDPTATDTNPFRYCGEYYDDETGYIYLRNRYYDPSAQRFITEDPAKDGMNWYAYCGGNPIMFVDPSGLEYLVVSGSEKNNGITDRRYKYNFIEPAIKKLRELKGLNDGETITWLISSTDYSSKDIENFKNTAKNIGVNIYFFDNKEQFIGYINTKGAVGDNSARMTDKIEMITVFSHGLVGSLEFGYHQSNQESLSITSSDINRMNASAFDNTNSCFYSCNTGTTNANGTSFAQMWVNKTGGRAAAVVNKTSYHNINNAENWETVVKPQRKETGYRQSGSDNYPVPASDAYWKIFMPNVTIGG